LLRDAKHAVRTATADVAAAMVSDELVAKGQARLGENRTKGVGDEGAVDEHNRIAFTDDLVLQRDAVEDGAL
jgi:hypothetical protein